MRKIILASSSPRRKQLLQDLIGNNFEIIPSSYNEENVPNMDPVKLALHHSLQKARYIAKKLESGIIIGVDTFVVLGNIILGKPYNKENAKKMLMQQSGRNITVVSGLALIDIDNKKEIQDYEITKVKIKKLSEKEINMYIKTGESLDKAGAFGVQGKGALFVERIEGCYFNIVGMPLFRLNTLFQKIGINLVEYNN